MLRMALSIGRGARPQDESLGQRAFD